jgi:hypothetical protein
METKVCSACKVDKPLSEFSPQRTYADGHRGQCKVCRRAYQAAYLKNPEKRENKRLNDKCNGPKRRRRHVYGLNENQYKVLLSSQNHRCAICKEAKILGVDHCHYTGTVRGLLCNRCNSILGKMGDTYDLAMRFVIYLRDAETGSAGNGD